MRAPRLSVLLGGLAFLVLASCAPLEKRATPVAADSPAAKFVAGVKRTVLPNGLTVLVHEQKGSGVVSVMTWVKAGYFNEPDEVAGMAHLFEHMFFKGSRAFPEEAAIAQAIANAGGSSNASTTYDSTSYYIVVPRDSFQRAVEIQADAIAHPRFEPESLRKEAEVVIEESNRKYDNPGAVTLERMFATSFTQHRMKRWRIGSNEVLRNIRRDNLMAFFDTLYRPENIVVSIAGDVNPDEALKEVERQYGGIPKGQLRKERGPKEPPQAGFRFGHSEADIREGYGSFGWHTVPSGHADEEVLEVLASILGGGRSSRLYRAGVGNDGASSLGAGHLTFDDVGIFFVNGTMPERNRATVESRIVAEIERLKRHGPTEYELAKVKNIREANLLGDLETSLEQAQMMARYEARGSYRDIATRLDRLKAVTAGDVRAAAKRYLTTDKLTVYHYQPKGTAAIAAEAELQRLRTAEASAGPAPVAEALPELPNSVRPAGADAPPQTMALSNGATLVVQQKTSAPIVATGIFFRGGRTAETPANAGITRLMQFTMRRGTRSRDAEAIDREIEFLGTQIGITNASDGFGFSFGTASRFYEPALRIAADVLLDPVFAPESITREKGLQLAALRRTMDTSADRATQLYREAMFGNHPYGLPEQGSEKSIAALDRAALQAWWKSSIAADRAMIVVVGNVDAQDVKRVMEQHLAGLARSAGSMPTVPAPVLPTTVKEAVEERDRRQTAMTYAFPIVPPSHPQWLAFRILQNVTTGGGGTFYNELRTRQTLAYVVGARPVGLATHGVFTGSIACDASKEAQAKQSLLVEMRKLQGEGVTQADIVRAKSQYAGSTVRAREAASALASEYGNNYILGLPLDQVDRQLKVLPALGLADVHAAARTFLSGDNYVYAAVRGKPGAK